MGGNPNNNMNNNNNRRTLGNIINRVFESAGPDGKVRGTPQQIIDKYQALARDAQLAGDRVAAESFLQHSEHYTRMLGEAQAQQTETRQSFDREDGQRDDAGRDDGRREDGRRDEFRREDARRDESYDQPRQPRHDGQNAPQPQRQPQPQPQMHQPPPQHQPAISSGLAMIDPTEDGDFGGLIETPESATSAPPPNPAPMAVPNGAANGSHYEAAAAPAPETPPSEAPKRGRPRRKAPAPRPEGEAPAPAPQQSE